MAHPRFIAPMECLAVSKLPQPDEPWVAIEERDIESYLDRGYILRMSAKGHSPSGIRPESIIGRKHS